ncbi:MAG: hypothetical protein CND89_04290 [Marine Group II euryarchaeote MED-G38]|nr:MAG: hypothetical protein CND89_04290 [Marine Group II euryarchaeote MED-G38]
MDLELPDNVRQILLISTVVLVLFELLNMTGIVFGGDKLFLIDLITSSDYEAFRPDTGLSTQDIVGLLLAAILGAVWYLSAEDDLDWESLLADDDEE